MGTVTDLTYYENGVLSFPSVGQLDNFDKELNNAIARYEKQLLFPLFKPSEYDAFVLALEDIENADQKWKDLVLGKTYTIDGIEKRWQGLRADILTDVSLVAAFVYCGYLAEKNSPAMGVNGAQKVNVSGVQSVDISPKYDAVFNDMFLNNYQNDYSNNSPSITKVNGGYAISYVDSNINKSFVTLEQYFIDFKEEYSLNIFPRYEHSNYLNI